jgi:hypothetical protein
MWQLITESPTRAAKTPSGRRPAARTEPFLDFDPILPGWPAAEAPETDGEKVRVRREPPGSPKRHGPARQSRPPVVAFNVGLRGVV